MRTLTAAADTTSTTMSIEWTSSLGPTAEISDTGTPLHPPFIRSSPPKSSLASFWSLNGSNESEVLMILVVPVSTIIDVWLDFVLQDGQTPVLNVPSNGATVGEVYCFPLDGFGSSAKLIPVSYTSTN